MTPTTAEFLFEILNVGLLAAGLGWVLFKPVRQALADDAKAHADQQAALDATSAQLSKDQDALQAAKEAFEADNQAQAAARLEAAKAEAQRVLDASRKAAEDRQAAWEADASARQTEAARRSSLAVAQVAGNAVRQLLEGANGPDLELALARAALTALPAPAEGPATVEVASEPSEALQALLHEGLPMGFSVSIRPELAAGLRVATSAGLVDSTALAMAQDATDAVVAALARPTEASRD